jgi:hypothetical protein
MVYFQTQNPKLGKSWRALEWKNDGIFYGNLQYSKAILYILWPFGSLVVIWCIFSPLWYFVSRKSGNPAALHQGPATIFLSSDF